MSDLPALQGVNGPVGGTRAAVVGLAEGEAEVTGVDVGVGLVVSEGLGDGAAIADPVARLTARRAPEASPAEILSK